MECGGQSALRVHCARWAVVIYTILTEVTTSVTAYFEVRGARRSHYKNKNYNAISSSPIRWIRLRAELLNTAERERAQLCYYVTVELSCVIKRFISPDIISYCREILISDARKNVAKNVGEKLP